MEFDVSPFFLVNFPYERRKKEMEIIMYSIFKKREEEF